MGALDSALLAAVRAGASRGRPYFVGAKTAAYTVLPQDCYGGVITNEGASGTVVLSLPSAEVGMSLTVLVLAAQVVQLDPSGSEIINAFGAAAGDSVGTGAAGVVAGAAGDCISIACVEDGEWIVTNYIGTWDDIA